MRETLAGWLHFFVFWGFTVLGLQIVTMFGRAYSPDFYVWPFTPGLLGGPYFLVRDLFEITVFLCIVILIARWAITRPMRLIGFLPAEARQRSHPLAIWHRRHRSRLAQLLKLEESDLLRYTILGQREVLSRESRHRPAVFVFHVDRLNDQLRRRLKSRCRSGLRVLADLRREDSNKEQRCN